MTTKRDSRGSTKSTKRINCPDISQARHDALAILDAAYPEEQRRPGDITIDEYAAARNISRESARYRLDTLVRAGRLVRVRGVATPGSTQRVTVYRVAQT